MSTMKKCQVILLPTNKKAPLANNHGKLVLANGSKDKLFDTSKYIEGDRNLKPQHLYILSDEEIKEGDWVYNTVLKDISYIANSSINLLSEINRLKQAKKIIATTDSSLTKTSFKVLKDLKSHQLPQPSSSFLEVYVKAYNEGNQIKEVMVEYDAIPADRAPNGWDSFVKVDSKNIITIKRLKDSWNREEVIELCESAYNQADKDFNYGFGKWVEQNL